MTFGIDDRYDSPNVSFRVLVTVHGYERPGWGPDTGHVVSRWGGAVVRVLALLDVPCPPRTSPTPLARRAYEAARADWRRLEEQRLEAAVEALVPALPRTAEVMYVPCVQGDPVRTIAEHVDEWPADVLVIGAPAGGLRTWFWPGPVHERLLRRLHCAVLVTPPPRPAARRAVRITAVPRPIAAHRRA